MASEGAAAAAIEDRHAADSGEDEGGMPESRAVSFEARLVSAEERALLVERSLKDAREYLARIERQAAAEAAEDVVDEEEQMGMDVDYSGCYMDEDLHEAEWWPEAILGRRVKRGKLYYKVKWRGHNIVTWELDDDIENRNAVKEYEAFFKLKVETPPTARRRFVPPSYASRRIFKKGREPVRAVPPHIREEAQLRPEERALWSCEVERFIWIPYEDDVNRAIEQAYRERKPNVTVLVPGRGAATIDFETMMQRTGTARPVQRTVQLPEEEERRRIESMSLDELRRYIAGIVDFQPVHYEVLARLHEADKVVVTASSAEVDALPSLTFGQMIEQIASGAEFLAFSDECHICLEDYAPDSSLAMLPQCGHTFHRSCIRDYFTKYSKLCPVCKAPLS